MPRCAFPLLLSSMVALAATTAPPRADPPLPALDRGGNLVANGGFEDGVRGWDLPAGLMSVDAHVSHTGRASLRFSWDDAAKRRLALQPVPVQPGKRYLMRAWLKCEGVRGALKGATFGVEWGGKDRYLGGASPMGVGWSRDWTEVTFLSGVVPREATWAHVYVTLDWGGVGTAWIDDISVTPVDGDGIFEWRVGPESVVGASDSPPFAVVVGRIRPEVFGEGVDVAAALCSPPWNARLAEQKGAPRSGARLTFPAAALDEGVYTVSAEIRSRASGRALVEPEVRTVRKRPPLECLISPHSGILLPSDGYPEACLRAYRAGRVTGEAARSDGRVTARLTPCRLRPGESARLRLPGRPPAPGRYALRLRLSSPGRPICTTAVPFTVLQPSEAARGVVIGRDNLLRDRGKPWFPMFVYAHTAYAAGKGELERRDPHVTAEMLDQLGGTPFGLLDYATPIGGLDDTVALADACARRGIRLALSVKDLYPGWPNLKVRAKEFPGRSPEQIVRALARRLRDNPALAVYYTNDELSTQYFGRMRAMRRWLHEEDPLHPTLHVHYDLECIHELAPSYDIFGPELYPWPADDLVRMAGWSDRVVAALPDGAPFWGCLWLFRDEPLANEKQRALTYLAIAKGARGLLFYSYHDLKASGKFLRRWPELVALGREVEGRLPILLQPASAQPCRTRARGVALRTVSGPRGTWLLAVNADRIACSAEIQAPQRFRQALEGDEALPIAQGRLDLHLDPFQVRLTRLQ